MSQTSPSETRLRLRAVLNAQFTVILAVCLVAAAVGGGLVYTTHVDPGTETETRTVPSLTVETEYVHSAEVTEPNSVFDTGTVLDGRDTYFTRIAPVLDVGVQTSYAADAASDVDVSFESVLVVQNVGGEGETVYWDERETLMTETVSGVEPEEPATASFALNSSEVAATASEIESDLGTSPGETETFVETDVTVEGTINGEATSYTQPIEMTIEHGGDTYTVSEPGVQSNTREQSEQVTVERSYGPLRSVGGPLLFLAGLAGAGGLAYARREVGLALTPAERVPLVPGRSRRVRGVDHLDPAPRTGPRAPRGRSVDPPGSGRLRDRQRHRRRRRPGDGRVPRRDRRVRVHLHPAGARGRTR
jgi:hypothetical protein